ncbi:MAG: CBS domain-containing protein [Candidatus Bathyarchaeia archaeon]
MELELTYRMIVREAMSSPAITIGEDKEITEVARVMDENNIGAVIVLDQEDRPVGIVTERDIVVRVVAKGRNPWNIKAGEVMSSPLITVVSETPLIDAMMLMSRLNIRRLGVTYKGSLVGVVTERDILRIVPTIIEIVRERSKIQGGVGAGSPSLTGICERCGAYSMNLKAVEGMYLCEDCVADEEV